jgi:hypothetical protein
MPDFTDHGIQHSNDLMRILSNFCKNLEDFNLELSEEEKYLICLAIWLHDIGVLITREEEKEKHNENSVKVLESKEFEMLTDIFGKDKTKCLKYVIKLHSSHADLESVPKHTILPDVRLKLICAIFRLIDGCDITSARTTRVLYNLLSENNLLKADSQPYWAAHLCISSAVFQKGEIIVDCDDIAAAKLLTDHLIKDLDPINKVFREEKFPEFNVRVVKSPI